MIGRCSGDEEDVCEWLVNHHKSVTSATCLDLTPLQEFFDRHFVPVILTWSAVDGFLHLSVIDVATGTPYDDIDDVHIVFGCRTPGEYMSTDELNDTFKPRRFS